MKFFNTLVLTSLAALSIAAHCEDEIAVPTVPSLKAIDVTDRHISRTAQFTIWKPTLDGTDLVGIYRHGLFCVSPSKLYYNKDSNDWLRPRIYKAFVDRSSKLGYPKYAPNDSAFEIKIGNDANFKIGATLLAYKFDECGSDSETKGSIYVKIKWEVYSIQAQKVVYSKIIGASYTSTSSMKDDDFFDAFANAEIDNLLADPDYVSVFETGNTVQAKSVELSKIALTAPPVIKQNVAKDSKSLLNAVVTIESNLGSGSGFYISNDGYLLTNQHVVGGAKFVKIKYSDGRSTVGEVLRIDNVRDVALIKTEKAVSSALNIRQRASSVGEEVYVIGSPFGETFAGTVTHGVLSSHRTIDGITYLQSDASVKPGNSGGPLIDTEGRVIGIAELRLDETGGLNMFIPIDEALEKLGLSIS